MGPVLAADVRVKKDANNSRATITLGHGIISNEKEADATKAKAEKELTLIKETFPDFVTAIEAGKVTPKLEIVKTRGGVRDGTTGKMIEEFDIYQVQFPNTNAEQTIKILKAIGKDKLDDGTTKAIEDTAPKPESGKSNTIAPVTPSTPQSQRSQNREANQ